MRDGADGQLAWLIPRRSGVRIPLPLPTQHDETGYMTTLQTALVAFFFGLMAGLAAGLAANDHKQRRPE